MMSTIVASSPADLPIQVNEAFQQIAFADKAGETSLLGQSFTCLSGRMRLSVPLLPVLFDHVS